MKKTLFIIFFISVFQLKAALPCFDCTSYGYRYGFLYGVNFNKTQVFHDVGVYWGQYKRSRKTSYTDYGFQTRFNDKYLELNGFIDREIRLFYARLVRPIMGISIGAYQFEKKIGPSLSTKVGLMIPLSGPQTSLSLSYNYSPAINGFATPLNGGTLGVHLKLSSDDISDFFSNFKKEEEDEE